MLQAIAGFYAYFTVLHGYGFLPAHLLDLDRERVFNNERTPHKLRDAYYLWCFEPDITSTCIYLPVLWDGIIPGTDVEYQSESEFQEWLGNNEDYAKDAKQYLVDRWDDVPNTENIDALTMNMLTSDDDSFTWRIFQDRYWRANNQTGLFAVLSKDTFHAENSNNLVLYPNRRCFDEDYAILWKADEEKNFAPPPLCNTQKFSIKPRTNRFDNSNSCVAGVSTQCQNNADSDACFDSCTYNSLFPMMTRTRAEALRMSNSAYFISIIVVQWADLMICKTRIRSLFEQGMTNTFMNYALFFETILGAFLVYVPVANTVTGTRPLRFTWWTAAVPFSLAIYIYDELRKGWIRKNRFGWLHRNTYW